MTRTHGLTAMIARLKRMAGELVKAGEQANRREGE
jgi:hypothetical protein